MLQSLLPLIKGFTVLYWATGTWWIPMLLALGAWTLASVGLVRALWWAPRG